MTYEEAPGRRRSRQFRGFQVSRWRDASGEGSDLWDGVVPSRQPSSRRSRSGPELALALHCNTELVSTFWAGALSSLVGALVGGLFTAIGSWIQARATSRSAAAAVALTYEKQLEFVRGQKTHDAMALVAQSGSTLMRALDRAKEFHEENADGRHKPVTARELRDLLTAVGNFDDVYDFQGAQVPSVLQDYLSEILDSVGFTYEGWANMARREDSEGDECCAYGQRLAESWQACSEMVWWVRQAQSEVVSGNKDAPILRTDPRLWYLMELNPGNLQEAIQWRKATLKKRRTEPMAALGSVLGPAMDRAEESGHQHVVRQRNEGHDARALTRTRQDEQPSAKTP